MVLVYVAQVHMVLVLVVLVHVACIPDHSDCQRSTVLVNGEECL